MSKITRDRQEEYTLCDSCGLEITDFSAVMVTWPVIYKGDNYCTGGLLRKAKVVFANWYGKKEYHFHAECVDKILRNYMRQKGQSDDN